MIDQHQQESRAGRDGQRAMAITYTRPTIQRTSKVPEDAYGLVELEDWAASSDQCLRVIPSSYLDGVPVTCLLLPGAELCCFCEGQVQLPPPARHATLSKYIRDAVSVAKGPATKVLAGRPPLNILIPPPKTPRNVVAAQSHFLTPAFTTPSSAIERRYDIFVLFLRGLTDYLRSSTLYNSSSPSVFAAAQDEPAMVSDTPLESPISSVPNSAKRAMGGSNISSSKRPRLSDTILFSGLSSLGSQSTRQPTPSAGLAARVDSSVVLQGADRFDAEVRQPIFQAMEHISGHCIPCLMVNDDEWETHKTDRCQSLFMNFPKDAYFVAFKNAFKFAVGFCYGCGLDMVCVLPL